MECDGSGDMKPSQNPVERFEKAFQACLSVITKEDTFSNLDHDEIRVDTEYAIKDLMDKARSVEAYFLKKRLHISYLKPELILKDETNELRMELIRKDELLKKNFDKINQWQAILADVQSGNTASTMGGKVGMNPNPVPAGIPISMAPGGGMNLGGPLTPTTPGLPSRPQNPGMLGRPMTPMGSPMTPQGSRMYPGMPSQSPLGLQQQQPSSGLQGPLAFLEKTASNIPGMNP